MVTGILFAVQLSLRRTLQRLILSSAIYYLLLYHFNRNTVIQLSFGTHYKAFVGS